MSDFLSQEVRDVNQHFSFFHRGVAFYLWIKNSCRRADQYLGRIEENRLLDPGWLAIDHFKPEGFEGALTLPVATVLAWGLAPRGWIDASLADGSSTRLDAYEATIIWDGRDLPVAVLAMDGSPLVGTALLDGFNLNVDFKDGGSVAIQRL